MSYDPIEPAEPVVKIKRSNAKFRRQKIDERAMLEQAHSPLGFGTLKDGIANWRTRRAFGRPQERGVYVDPYGAKLNEADLLQFAAGFRHPTKGRRKLSRYEQKLFLGEI